VKEIRVMIVEDDAFSRSTLIDALRHQGFSVVGATENAQEAIAISQKFAPNVAICDLDLGIGPTGLDVAHALRRANAKIGLIILTSYRDPRLADPQLPSLPIGAILMNKKELTSMAILGMQLNAAAKDPLKKRKQDWAKSGKFQTLSTTQIEILRSIAEGMSTADIAKSRDVSEQSIEKTIQRICRNLEIPITNDRSQRIQLVRAFFFGAGHEI
jgi:DNA-binding NarL/FixJ family response regulator